MKMMTILGGRSVGVERGAGGEKRCNGQHAKTDRVYHKRPRGNPGSCHANRSRRRHEPVQDLFRLPDPFMAALSSKSVIRLRWSMRPCFILTVILQRLMKKLPHPMSRVARCSLAKSRLQFSALPF